MILGPDKWVTWQLDNEIVFYIWLALYTCLTLCCMSHSFVSNIYFQFQVKISDFSCWGCGKHTSPGHVTVPLCLTSSKNSVSCHLLSMQTMTTIVKLPPPWPGTLSAYAIDHSHETSPNFVSKIPSIIKYDTSKVVELVTWRKKEKIKIIIGVDSFWGSYNDHAYFSFQLGNLRQLGANFWQASFFLDRKTLNCLTLANFTLFLESFLHQEIPIDCW